MESVDVLEVMDEAIWMLCERGKPTADLEAARAAVAELVALSSVPAVSDNETDGEEFEIWQDGVCVAGCSGPHYEAMREAAHYAAEYGQDGTVEVFRIHRTRVDLSLQPNA